MNRVTTAILPLSVVAAVMASTSPVGGVAGFGDVDDDRFFTAPVQWMVDNDTTTGTSPSTFSPEDPVTRGQFAAFAYRWKDEPAVEIDPVGRICIRITGEGTAQL